MAKWSPNSEVSDLKLLGGSMVDSTFHPFEVDEMSEYQELFLSWHSPIQR